MYRSYVELLTARYSEQPDRRAYRFLESGDTDGPISELTYAELGRRARAVAAYLQAEGWSGRRALLLYPPGLGFLAGFYGSLFGDVVAVPVPLPQFHESDRSLRRLHQVIADAEIDLVLSTRQTIDGLAAVADRLPQLASLTWIATEEIPDDLASAWQDPDVGPERTAFLQYTSGSTSAPSGVVISHGNLLHNQEALAAAMGHTPDQLAERADRDWFVSWLPVYHDMGLILPVLHAVYLGSSTVLMSPDHFVQKPQRWLEAISHYRIHTAGCPNFGYELCVRRVAPEVLRQLDLSSWRVAFNGAEPVRPSTLRRFAQAAAPAGFRREALLPVYGLAEATLLVTGGVDGGVESEPVIQDRRAQGESEWVSSGRPPEGIALAIADPERGAELPDGTVGEIWVGGDSVAQGYLGNEAKTRAVFGAALTDGRSGFLRTGDLGFRSDGHLFVTGRIKDLLIVDGRNHYPQDLELTAENAHPSVRAGCIAAFTVDDPERGELPVVVAEVKATERAELAEITTAVRAAVAVEHGLTLDGVALVRPRTIFKTSSGKIERRATKSAYLAGELALVAGTTAIPATDISEPAEPTHAEDIADWLARAVARVTGLETTTIDRDRSLAEFGLGSRALVELIAELSDHLGTDIDPALVFEHPTVAAIATTVSEVPAAAQPPERAAPPVGVEADTGVPDSDAIAIVSLACRFPGGADDPDALWRLLADAVDAVGPVPAGRWSTAGLVDTDPDAVGTAYTTEGGYLDRIDEFDAAFFGITGREAAAMDPQQRLLLQTAWEAFERARIDPEQLSGTATGVYVGLYDSGYLDGARPDQLDGYVATGNAGSVASGRIAYALGLQGPAVTVDTACSSSLVALHQAAQALRAGECDLALAGGVSLLVTPRSHIEFSRLRGLSPSGRCRPFGADADGIVWSEGCGLVVVKRLDAALRDGDPILAVLRGSAINQDGRSQGLSAPNGVAQEKVLRAALSAARLRPGDIDYVEAHGTGTPLGDPVEARALARVFGPGRPADRPLGVGSLKSNIGHTGAAAGIGGVIKVVLALRHGRLPASLHAGHPTPRIDWNASGLAIRTEAADWPAGDRPRRAGVSAFGISGTNAHVILEEPPRPANPGPDVAVTGATRSAGLFVLSARSERALRGQARRLLDRLSGDPALPLAGVARSLVRDRARLPHRAVVVGDRDELAEGLEAIADGTPAPQVVVGDGAPIRSGKVAFVFPGQGAQWAGMAVDLLDDSPAFAAELARADAAIRRYTGWSVTAVLRRSEDAPALRGDDVVQPVLFAVMAALAAQWRSRGVEPDAVIGHSQGEVAAAYVAGALSLADAAAIVVLRSRALPKIAGTGAMAVVGLPEHEVLARSRPGVAVAAVNSRLATVVAGDRSAVTALLDDLARADVFTRLLAVDYASHTAHVEPLRAALAADLEGIIARPGDIDWYSTVTGERFGADPVESGYWYRNLREPVRFAATVHRMLEDGYRYFVEPSPHPSLTTAVRAVAEDARQEVVAVGSLRRDRPGATSLDLAAAELHTGGMELDWNRVLVPAAPVELPTYAWDTARYWIEPRRASAVDFGLAATGHPILGVVVPRPESGAVALAGRLSRHEHPWLADHVVLGRAIVPGAALVEWAVRAGDEVGSPVVRDLVLREPLVVPADAPVAVQVIVEGPGEDGERAVAVHSRVDDGTERSWTLHGEGVLSPSGGTAGAGPVELADWPPDGALPVPVEGFYERLEGLGYDYGASFRGLRAAWRSGDDLFAEVALSGAAPPDRGSVIDPALLDTALHVLALTHTAAEPDTEAEPDTAAEPGTVRLPFTWSGVTLYSIAGRALRVRVRHGKGGRVRVDLADGTGAPVAEIEELTLAAVRADQLSAAAQPAPDALHAQDWVPIAQPATPDPFAWTDIGVERDGAGQPVLTLRGTDRPLPGGARSATAEALASVQKWLRRADPDDILVVLTRRAVSTGEDEDVLDPAHAPVWGLLRAAQAEHPERLVLVDLDDWDATPAAVAAALTAGEPQLALRSGTWLVPRLVRLRSGEPIGSWWPATADPEGTVLITGGTGALGKLLARHLVTEYGVRHLVLAGRSGGAAPGVSELVTELAGAGARVRVVAADLSDRAAVTGLLAEIPAANPLTAIVHAAGARTDALFTAVAPRHVAETFDAKVDPAWLLHELTADRDLAAFVLFSSVAGVLGSPGQAAYAAANTFLDALARYRRHRGLPATALAWSLWQEPGGLTSGLTTTDRARLARLAGTALTPAEGLALFDAALRTGRSLLVPARLGAAGPGPAPARPPASTAGSGLGAELSGAAPEEQEQIILTVIRQHLAEIVDHTDPRANRDGRTFTEIGVDSLGSVEFRNRLQVATGLKLPITVTLEHPTPGDLARFLRTKLGERG
ncbi:type I polyketide synthase [Nocardia sp. BMG51109]|uniref:type I polyketide synthase n=1 Tax=Nocardia sp. BMG51109 TaxID=1056816 RepID=UPI0004B7D150|nr:type I polyketide synthase [Nocardia sp. BMG51109]